jgi:hypothetical protein
LDVIFFWATFELHVLRGVYLSIFFVSLLFLAQTLRDKTLWGWQRLKRLAFARKNPRSLFLVFFVSSCRRAREEGTFATITTCESTFSHGP